MSSAQPGFTTTKAIQPTTRLVCCACGTPADRIVKSRSGWHYWLCRRHHGLTEHEIVLRESKRHGFTPEHLAERLAEVAS